MGEARQVSQQEVYEMWMKCKPMWQRWAYKMNRVDYTQDDWAQHSYLICMKALESYDVDKGITFTAYYRMVLYREGRQKMDKKRDMLIYDEYIQDEQPDESIDIEKQMIEMENGKEITKALQELPQAQRQIIVGYYIYEYSLGEIAEQLGIKYKTLESWKKKAMNALRKKLEKNSFKNI